MKKDFEELRHSTTAKKYLEIIETLIHDYEKDDVVQIFRCMLLDHEICCQVVGNGKNIEDFYDRIINIINNIELIDLNTDSKLAVFKEQM